VTAGVGEKCGKKQGCEETISGCKPVMFSYVALEERIPADHPLRGVRKLVDVVLGRDVEGVRRPVFGGGRKIAK